MSSWLLGTGIAAGLLAAAAAGLSVAGARRWSVASRELVERLDRQARRPTPGRFDPAELAGLPPPVQRYFRAVLKDGQPMLTAASLVHRGTMDMAVDGGVKWKPFRSTQNVVMRRPGFLWNARIAIAPGVPVRVHDAYVAGEGVLHAAVLGLFDVAALRGNGDLARGELMRFLAEAAWYPTALLPSQGVVWTAVDDRSARVTLADGPVSVTLLFRFDDKGLIASGRAEARARMVDGRTVLAPWEWQWSDWRMHDGVTVPFAGEVAWMLPQGRKPYWRGTVTALHLETAR